MSAIVTKKPRPSAEGPRSRTTVKIDVDLHRKARTVASYNGLELVDYLDQIIRPVVEKAFREMGQQIREDG